MCSIRTQSSDGKIVQRTDLLDLFSYLFVSHVNIASIYSSFQLIH